MPGPILNTMELKRLPFARRPIAQPGTVLVFQMPDNQLVAPHPPYTTGETWWKGPKMAYVVDNRPHGGVFECRLPAAGDALFFDATVRFTWRVCDAVEVVREQVEDPETECRAYLERNLPTVTRGHQYNDPAGAEREVVSRVGRQVLPLRGRGIQLEAVHATLRIPLEQIPTLQGIGAAADELTLAMLKEKHIGEIEALKRARIGAVVSGGPESLYVYILQEDPSRGMEVVTQMRAMAERDKQLAIEAIKVLIEGGEIRVGELDGAVAAAVEGFRNIVGQYATGPSEVKSAIAAGAASPADDANNGKGDDGGAGPA